MISELVGAGIEFSVGKALVLKEDRRGLWGTLDLLLEEVMYGVGGGILDACVIPIDQHLLAFSRREQRQGSHGSIRVLEGVFQERLVEGGQAAYVFVAVAMRVKGELKRQPVRALQARQDKFQGLLTTE